MVESQWNVIERKISIEPIEYYLEFDRSIEIRLRSTIEFQWFDCVRSGSIGSIVDPVRLRSSGLFNALQATLIDLSICKAMIIAINWLK